MGIIGSGLVTNIMYAYIMFVGPHALALGSVQGKKIFSSPVTDLINV